MIDWILLGIADNWCNDFLTPPHMPWWLGRGLGKVVGCWGHESMMPLLIVVVTLTTWHLIWLRRTHLRKES